MNTMQATTLNKINRSHAERIAAEGHLVYELRKRSGQDPDHLAQGRSAGPCTGSAASQSHTPGHRMQSPSRVSPAGSALDNYIARAEALVRPTGGIRPGAEADALDLLCSIVAARRANDPPSP